MNAYNLITGAIHSTSGRFSDYWDFASLINHRYGELPYEQKTVRSRLRQDIERMTTLPKQIDQSSVFELLVARDLAKADAQIDNLPEVIELSQRLQNAYTSTISILRGLGLEFPDPAFFIVDQFPEPYQKMDWVAFAPDKADQKNYGIKSGVYLLESELSPYYSELTLAHEIVHSVIGIENPYLLGRGLEEGIAEIIGTLYIGALLYSPQIAQNVFIHTRFGNRASQSNALYFDYTRQAFLIYRRFGLDGLVHLIRHGREAIKSVEALCLSGDIDAISLPASGWNDMLTSILEKLLLGTIPNLVVSPLAAYIAEFVTPDSTFEDVAAAAKIDVQIVKEALEEIQDRTFAVLLDKEKIAYSDLSFIISSGSLRYEVLS